MNVSKLLITRGKAVMLLLFGAVMLVLAGCKEEEPPMISASRDNIQIGIEAQQIPLTVQSNTYWTASIVSGGDWITLSNTEGFATQTIYIYVKEHNASAVERTAVIELRTKENTKMVCSVMIVQNPGASTLLISPSSISIDKSAQTVGIAVASNSPWTVSVDKQDVVGEFTRTGDGNGTIDVPVLANDTHNDRTVTITVTAGEGTGTVQKNVTITQGSLGTPTLFLSQTSLSFEAAGGNANVAVITNLQGAITATSDFVWVDASVATDANGLKTVAVTASPNTDNISRDAIIIVVGEVDGVAVSQQIRVTQAGVGSPTITLLSNNVQVESDGRKDVGVGFIKSNENISVTLAGDYPEWITPSGQPTSTGVNGTLTFDVAENTDQSMRQGVLNLVASIGNQSLVYPVSVIQNGVGVITLQLIPAMVNAPASGLDAGVGTYTVAGHVSELSAKINVITADAPAGMVGPAAPSVSETGVDGMFTVTFQLSENSTFATRAASLLVTATEGRQTVVSTLSIVQAGVGAPNVVLVSNSITIPQAGVTDDDPHYRVQLLGATSNTKILSASAGGVTATPASATGSTPWEYLQIAAAPNNQTSAIKQTLYIVASQGGADQILALEVTQLGTGSPELMLPTPSVTFPAAGVRDFDISVIKRGGTTYTVAAKPTWIIAAAENEAGDALTVTVGANTTVETRSGEIVLLAKRGDEAVFYTIAVSQKGVPVPALTLVVTEVTATATQTSISIPILGDADGLRFSSYIEQPWISGVTILDNSLEIELQANDEASARVQTIKPIFSNSAGDQTLSVQVTQLGVGDPEVVPGATSLQFGPAAQTAVQVYISNEGATANDKAVLSVKNQPLWITSPEIINSNGALQFNVEANSSLESRSGVINVEAAKGGQTVMFTISVTQAGHADLAASLYPASVSVSNEATGEGNRVSVKVIDLPAGGVTYGNPVSSTNEWLSGTMTDNTLAVTVAANSGEARVGTLILKLTDNSSADVQHLTLTVNQEAASPIPNLTLSYNEISLAATSDSEASTTLQGYNSTDYPDIAVTSPDWISRDEATELPELKFTALSDNNTGVTRTAYIKIVVTKKDGTTQPLMLKAIQAAVINEPSVDLLADPTGIVLAKEANSEKVVVLKNYATGYQVQTQSSIDWIGATVDAGNVTIKANSVNAEAEPRIGFVTLTVTKPDGKIQKIVVGVMQEGTVPAAVQYPISGINAASGVIFAWDDQGKDTGKAKTIEVFGFDINQHDIRFGDCPSWLNTDIFETYFRLYSEEVNSSPTARSTDLDITILIKGTSTVVGQFTIPVTQLGFQNDKVYADPTGVVLAKESQSQKTVVLENFRDDDGTNMVMQRSADWFTVAEDGLGGIQITTASANTSAAPRVGTVTVTITQHDIPVQTLVVGVMQEGTVPAEIQYPIGGISAASGVTFAAGDATEAAAKDIDIFGFDKDVHGFSFNAPSWLTVEPPQSPMKIYPNSANTGSAPRSGKVDITILLKDTQTVLAQFSIPVTQLGTASQRPEVTFTPASHTATSDGGDVTVKVSNPSAQQGDVWTTSTDHPAWLTDISYDLPNNNLTFKVQPNTTTSARSGYIVLTDPSGQYDYSFPVTQAGLPTDPIATQLAWLDYYTSPVLDGSGAQSTDFILTLFSDKVLVENIVPALDDDAGWFTVSKAQHQTIDGLEDGAPLSENQIRYTVTPDANGYEASDARSGNVTITVESPSVSLIMDLVYTVNQGPKEKSLMTDISMTPYENAFDAAGVVVSPTTGTVTLNNGQNIEFTSVTSAIKSNANWFTVTDNFDDSGAPTAYTATLDYVDSSYEGEVPRFAVVEVTLKAYGYHDYVAEFQVGQYPEQPAGGVTVQHQYDIPAAAGTYTDIIKIANLPDGFSATNFSLHALAADLNGSAVFFSSPAIVAAAVDGEQYIKITTTANPGMYPRANLLTFDVTDGTETFTYNVILNQLGSPFIGDPDNPSMNPDLSYLLDLSNITDGMWNTLLYPNRLRPSDSGDTIYVPLKQLPEGVTVTTVSVTSGSDRITSATISNGQLVIDCVWVLLVGGNADVTVTLSNGQVITVPVNTSPTIGDSN